MSIALQQYKTFFQQTPYNIDVLANEDEIRRILQLKAEKNVVILGHNYMAPMIYNLSERGARGDSLALAKYAAETTYPIILFDGVVFMAETAKILNPDKKVLIASKAAGCSLADPIRAEQVVHLKELYPGVPVVTYVNSYADVKAESDICCTSANAVKVIMWMATQSGNSTILFLPDSLMGMNLQAELHNLGCHINLIYPGKNNDMPEGRCEVHDKFTLEDLLIIRQQYDIPKGHPRRGILAHWECRPEVLVEADFYGSTSQMSRYIEKYNPERVYLATECEMAANLEGEFPHVEFIRTCQIYCRHMRQITLDGILSALESEDAEKHEVTVDEETRQRAYIPIKRMLDITC